MTEPGSDALTYFYFLQRSPDWSVCARLPFDLHDISDSCISADYIDYIDYTDYNHLDSVPVGMTENSGTG